MSAHQVAIVYQAEYGKKNDGQEQAVDYLSDEQHPNQRQVGNDGDGCSNRHQESKYADEDRGFTETARYALLKSKGFAD